MSVGPGSVESPAAAKFLRRLGPLLVALVAFVAACAIARLGLLLPVRADLSFPEAAVVARSLDVAAGRPAYQDWRRWPHAFAPYGPLAYYPVGGLARWMARAEVRPRMIYLLGRIESLAALLGIGCLLGRLAWKLGAGPLGAGLAVGLALLWLRLFEYCLSFRPDGPQVFFSLAALGMILGGEPTARRATAALGLLSISFWFKPSSWGMAIVVAEWLRRGSGGRRTAILLATFLAANLASAITLDRLWNGCLFLNMIGSLDNGWRPSNLPAFYLRLPLAALLVLVAAVVGAARTLIRRGEAPAPRWVAFALLATFAATSLQNLKVGADINYYLEAYALASTWTAAEGIALWRGRGRIGPVAPLVAFGLVAAPVLTYNAAAEVRSFIPNARTMRRGWEGHPLAERARHIDGLLLTTMPHLVFEAFSGPTVLDFVQYGILRARGRLEDAELIDRLETRAFSAVILSTEILDSAGRPGREPPFSPRFLPALFEHYVVEEQVGFATILRPRPGP